MLLLPGRTSCFYLVLASQYLLSQLLYSTPKPALSLQSTEIPTVRRVSCHGRNILKRYEVATSTKFPKARLGLTKQGPFHLLWDRGTEGAAQGRGISQTCSGFSSESRHRSGAFPAGKRCCFPRPGTVLWGRPSHYRPAFYCGHCTDKH